jgi:formylglycine-generating enzyme
MFRSVVCLLFLPFILDAQPRTGRDYAVFFYVTDFQPGIDDIPFTKGEAEELAAELGSNYGFSCAFVRECKKDSIIAALKEWNKILGPNDQVLFFFSMHGHYDASSDRGFLIPADGKKDDQDYNTWLSYDDLRTQIGRCKAGHILVALDACFSGSFGIPSYKNMPTGNDALFAPDCITRVNNVLQIKGRQFLTAGKRDEKTPQRSLLVAEFLSTLRKGYDIEGLIFFEDMAYQLHKIKNPEPEDGSFIGHKSGGDFVFVRKNGCYNFKEYTNEYKSDITGNCTEFANNINSCPTLKNLISDIEYWHYCNAKNQIEEYESYIKKFPNGQFAEFAKHKIEKLSVFRTSERDWETTLTQNTIDAYKAYAKKWPHQHVDDIKQKILAREQVIFDLEMITIEGGEFLMGNTESNNPDSTEMPHKVIVPDFRLGKYEVTYEQWKGVMGKLPQNVSYYFNDPDYKHSYRPDTCSLCPIASISYWELKKFIDKLNWRFPIVC